MGFIDQSALFLLHSNTDKSGRVAERQDEYYTEALSWPDRDQALDEALTEACQKFDVPDVHVR